MADDWNSTVLISELVDYSNLLTNQDDPIQMYLNPSLNGFNPENISFSSGGGYWGVKPVGEIVWKSFLFLPVVLLSVIGNLLILYVLYRFRQTRSYVNIFIGNMAIADLISTIFLSWTGIFSDFFQFYVLGETYCKLESFFKFTCLLTSAYSLLLLSADRLCKAVFPFKNQLTSKYACAVCGVIWIISLSLSVPFPLWREYKSRKWADLTETWCTEIRDTSDYWLGILIVLIYIPMISMTLSYGIILRKIRKYEERMNESGNSARGIYRKKIIIMLFVYLITALVCWAPFQLAVLFRRVYLKNRGTELPSWYETAKFVSSFMTCLNSAINPIIYGVVNETFRKAITLSFPCFGPILQVASGTRGRSNLTTLNNARFAPTSFVVPPGGNCIINANNCTGQIIPAHEYQSQSSNHSGASFHISNSGVRLDRIAENGGDEN